MGLFEDYQRSRFAASMRSAGDNLTSGHPVSAASDALRGFGSLVDAPAGALAGTRPDVSPPELVMPDLPKGQKRGYSGLAALPVEKKDKWGPVLDYLYGKDGEHWDEGITEMRQSPQGKQRFKRWQLLAKHDKAYAARYQELKSQYGNNPEAFWAMVVPEYREARKADARIAPKSATKGVAVNTALMAVPEIGAVKALAPAVKAGQVSKAQVASAALRSGTGASAITTAGKMARGAGGSLGRYAARSPVLGGTAAGAAAGALMGDDGSDVLAGALMGAGLGGVGSAARAGLMGERAAARAAAAGQKLQPALDWAGKPFAAAGKYADDLATRTKFGPTYDDLYALTGAQAPNSGVMASAGGFALLSGLAGGSEQDMAAHALVGAVAPRALRNAGLLRQASLGAAAGAVTASRMEDGTPLTGAFLGALAGPVAAKGFGALASKTGGIKALLHHENGELKEIGRYLGQIMPLQALRNFTSPDPTTAKNIETVYKAIDGQIDDMDNFVRHWTDEVATAMGPKIDDYNWRVQVFEPALGAVAKGDKAAMAKLDPATVEAARRFAKATAQLGDDLVDRGILETNQLLDTYIPHILDRQAFWNSFKGNPLLTDPINVRTLREKAVNILRTHSKFPKGTVVDGRKYRSARALAYKNPKAFFSLIQRDNTVPVGKSPYTFRGVTTGLNDAEYNALKQVFSSDWSVNPFTQLRILEQPSRRRALGAGKKRLNLSLPEEDLAGVFYQHALDRAGSNLPFLKDPLEAMAFYINKTGKKLYLDPLIKKHKVRNAFGELEDAPALLDKIDLGDGNIASFDDLFEGKENWAGLIGDQLRSALGSPSKVDEAFLNLFQNMGPGVDPDAARRYARLLADANYTGALGFAPVKATRNLFQSLLTATAVGPKWLADGMVEFNRKPDFWAHKARRAGALSDYHQEIIDLGKLSEATPLQRKWKQLSTLGMQMYKDSDTFNRTRAFTAGYLRANTQRMNAPLDVFRKDVQGKLRMLRDQAQRTGNWDEFATQYGRHTSDMTQWVYGKRGTPLAFQGPAGVALGMFGTWPANYAALLHHWAKSGQHQRIINMGLAASIADQAAYKFAGLKRATGLTSHGDEHEDGAPPIPLPLDPLPEGVPSPIIGTAFALPAAGKALISGKPNQGVREFRNGALLPAKPLFNIYDAYKLAQEGEPGAAAIKGMGGSPRE